MATAKSNYHDTLPTLDEIQEQREAATARRSAIAAELTTLDTERIQALRRKFAGNEDAPATLSAVTEAIAALTREKLDLEEIGGELDRLTLLHQHAQALHARDRDRADLERLHGAMYDALKAYEMALAEALGGISDIRAIDGAMSSVKARLGQRHPFIGEKLEAYTGHRFFRAGISLQGPFSYPSYDFSLSGIYEPVDDEDSENPPIAPEVAAALSDLEQSRSRLDTLTGEIRRLEERGGLIDAIGEGELRRYRHELGELTARRATAQAIVDAALTTI